MCKASIYHSCAVLCCNCRALKASGVELTEAELIQIVDHLPVLPVEIYLVLEVLLLEYLFMMLIRFTVLTFSL